MGLAGALVHRLSPVCDLHPADGKLGRLARDVEQPRTGQQSLRLDALTPFLPTAMRCSHPIAVRQEA